MRINRSGNFVLRGVAIENEGFKKLNLYNGTYRSGFRVVDFKVASQGIFTSMECQGVISTAPSGASANFWNWENQQQVGWAATDMVGGGTRDMVFSLVDSSIIIVDEIYISVNNNQGNTEPTNYYIELEPVNLEEYQYAMALIQNRSQGDLK